MKTILSRLMASKQRLVLSLAITLLAVFGAWRLVQALATFTPANQPIGYVAQLELTSYDLTSGKERVFATEYNREFWSGNLNKYPVDTKGVIDRGNPDWAGGAAALLEATDWNTGRYIATMGDDGKGTPFRSANLTAYTLSATVGGNAYTADKIVNYLRGSIDDVASDNSKLRVRASKLGDIVHSRPYYVDDDNESVFVGANDGMLHAFNGVNGTERWAYVPSMLLNKMKNLADPTTPHDYYVDGQIVIATFASTGKRILFGGLGGGGKGLYALNITSMAAASEADVAAKALWEITPSWRKNGTTKTADTTSFSHLGYTYGTPVATTVKIGSVKTDVLIVGNGYDDASTGKAYLYVIDAYAGTLIKEIAVEYTGGGALGGTNGIFSVTAVDKNKDGLADTVYGGDLNGTMWKFDLSSTSTASWAGSELFTTNPKQSITSTPAVADHPSGGFMVVFGTGRTLTGDYGTYDFSTSSWSKAATGDMGDTSTHYIYGIWDGAPGGNTSLLTQTLEERSYTVGTDSVRVRRSTANKPNWASGGNKGWQVPLPVGGERLVGEGSFIEGGRFYFNSYNPTVVPYHVVGTDTDIYGENWLMELDYLTGGSATAPFLDMDNNLLLNDQDRIVYTSADSTAGKIQAGKKVGDPITSPSQDGIPVGKWISTGVQSQPVLVQLSSLNTTFFNQNPDVIFPPTTIAERGVAGGHFDIDYFYGSSLGCSGSAASNAGVKAAGSVAFNYSKSKNVTLLEIRVGGELVYSGAPGSRKDTELDDALDGKSSPNYALSKNYNFDDATVGITAATIGTAYNGTVTVKMQVDGKDYTAGYTIKNVTGGKDASPQLSDSDTTCTRVSHDHEYDDQYDKTGVNWLNPSDTNYRLSKSITSTSTAFKVLMMNQYLNPAVNLHIGDASYDPNSAAGYISVRNYQTKPGLQLSDVQAYWRGTAASGDGKTLPIGSLVLNMPVDAFAVKNWWGGVPEDKRVGLQPTSPACAYNGLVDTTKSSGGPIGSPSADMYTPVIPPANGVDGAGTLGASTLEGARHNGALTLQIIKANTPNEALEENVAGRPEYGYRIKRTYYYAWVLAEYIIYWHHPNRVCYQEANTTWYNGTSGGNSLSSAASGAWNTPAKMVGTGWTKTPPEDTRHTSATSTPANGSTDPKLGILGSTGTVDSTTTSNGVTTITYTDGSKTVITRAVLTGGLVKITTVQYDAAGNEINRDEKTVADASGKTTAGGNEKGKLPKTGRISWRELFRL